MASILIELLFRNVESNTSLIRSSFSLFKITTACAFRVLLLNKLLLVQLREATSILNLGLVKSTILHFLMFCYGINIFCYKKKILRSFVSQSYFNIHVDN